MLQPFLTELSLRMLFYLGGLMQLQAISRLELAIYGSLQESDA